MEYRPKLERSRSCALPDVSGWCTAGRRPTGFERAFIDDDDDYDIDIDTKISKGEGPRRPPWTLTRMRSLKGLWRRIVNKGKRRICIISPSANGAVTRVTYDPTTYAKNFDDGSAGVEPENLGRSFSARFTVPSTMLH